MSLSCPKQGRSAYLRIWDPVTGIGPFSKRIIQNTKKFVDALKIRHAAKDAFVEGLAQQPGKMHIISSVPSSIREGKRVKKKIEDASFVDRTDFNYDWIIY